MNIRNYTLITETHYDNPNPGDILIRNGIEYLITEAEKALDNFPIFNYISIFTSTDDQWERAYKSSDYIIVAGTPQLGAGHIPERFNEKFYDRLRKAKELGIPIANLWAGICDTNRYHTLEESVDIIVNKHSDFIKESFSVYDYIVVRDILSKRVLDKLDIDADHLIDSVFYAADFHGVTKKENTPMNLLVARMLGPDFNSAVIKRFKSLQSTLDRDRTTFIVCHDNRDYDMFMEAGLKNVLYVNNPKSLLEVYSRANEVVSLRVHGSIPAILFDGRVCNLKIDSRSNNVEYPGIKSMLVDNFAKGEPLVFNERQESHIIALKQTDKSRFLNNYLNKVQKKLGNNFFNVAKKYVGADYWNASGNSGYANPSCKGRISEVLSNLLSKLAFSKGLVLGCAGGYFTHLINKLGKNVYGLDLSSVAVDAGKLEFTAIADKLSVSSIHDLSKFEDNSIDFFYSHQVMEHLPTELMPAFIEEVNRVAKPGAILTLFLVIGYEGQVAKAEHDVDLTHWNLKTKKLWNKLFKTSGFEVLEEVDIQGVSLKEVANSNNIHYLFYKKPE